MRLSHQGLTLWYATPDAPAPRDEVVAPRGVTVVVGAHPAKPTNAVAVRYRIDGGFIQSAPGRLLRTDDARSVQYFLVSLPPLPAGSSVEYGPVLRCAGRQVPSPETEATLPSRFSVASDAAAPPAAGPCAPAVVDSGVPSIAIPQAPSIAAPRASSSAEPPAPSSGDGARRSEQRFTPELDFVATVTIEVDTPIVIGPTPEGVRFDFFARGGTVAGPALHGEVLRRSADHLFVRHDGVAVLSVRAMIATDDGVNLEVMYGGLLDFGPDGHRRALANDLPKRATFTVTPRFLTGHPRYAWLNRRQCVGVGRIRLEDGLVEYDAFAVSMRPLPGWEVPR